jgi:hypothetical protein
MRTSQPGPEGRTAPAGWQRWLLPLGGIGVILALLALTSSSASPTTVPAVPSGGYGY